MSTFEADGIDYVLLPLEDVSNVWMYAIILVLTIFIFFLFRGICAMWKEVPQSENRTITRSRYTGGRATAGLPDAQSGVSSEGPKFADPLRQQEEAMPADTRTSLDAAAGCQLVESPQSPTRISKQSLD